MLANHVRVAKVLVQDLIDGERGHVVDVLQDVVLDGECRLELLAQDLLVEQVLDANADACVLVLVARPMPRLVVPILLHPGGLRWHRRGRDGRA